jgi:hypothetical protein
MGVEVVFARKMMWARGGIHKENEVGYMGLGMKK